MTSADPNGPAASVAFNAGWYSARGDADSPEILDVALDRASYKPGDTAKLRIATKQGGKALIAVLSGGLLSMQEAEIANGGGEVDVPVGDNWGPGAYVTAMLYRPMDESLKRMPSRAIGVAWLGLDQAANTLDVALDTPEKIKSGTTLTVPVKIGGPQERRGGAHHGCRRRSRHPQPDALSRRRRPRAGSTPSGAWGWRSATSTGASSTACAPSAAACAPAATPASRALQGNPPVEETVALFSGIVKVDADGTAKVDFDMPDFNGTVRVMAVAWSADKLGHASRDVIVRDAVALTASGPRFLTLGDEARLDIAVHNVEGPAAAYKLDGRRGHGERARRHARPQGGRAPLASTSRSSPPRSASSPTTSTSPDPNGIDVARHLTFDVKPPAGDIKRTTVASLKPGGGSITLSPDLVHDLIAGPHARQPERRPDRRARRAGSAHRARPLPLRLRRADGEPRAAAASTPTPWRRVSASRPTRS